MTNGAGFIYHCGEGQVGSLVRASSSTPPTPVALSSTFIGIHCNSIAAAEWQRWDYDQSRAPSSGHRFRICGSTAPRRTLRRPETQGVSMCLGSDWGPSGTKNVQGEIKVAKLVSQDLRSA